LCELYTLKNCEYYQFEVLAGVNALVKLQHHLTPHVGCYLHSAGC